MMGEMTPFEWFLFPAHYQGLSLAYGVTLISAACTIVLQGGSWSTILVGIGSGLMITTVTLPFVQMYWKLQWPWWLLLAALSGIASIYIMKIVIGAAKRVLERTPDIIDGGISRFQPNTPGGGNKP